MNGDRVLLDARLALGRVQRREHLGWARASASRVSTHKKWRDTSGLARLTWPSQIGVPPLRPTRNEFELKPMSRSCFLVDGGTVNTIKTDDELSEYL